MEKEKTNRPLDLDFDKLFANKGDGPPPELVVMSKTTNEQQSSSHSQRDNPEQMTDHNLSQSIIRVRHQIDSLAPKLPDKGAKLKANLKRMEDEQNRRKSNRVEKIDLECEKLVQSKVSNSSGACNGFTSSAPSHTQSSFTSLLSQKLEDKPDCSTRMTENAFDKEISYLTPRSRRHTKAEMLNKDRKEAGVSSRQSPFRCPASHLNKDKSRPSNGVQKHISSSTFYFPHPDGSVFDRISKRRRAHQMQTALDSKRCKGETVVLLDEEDQPAKTTQQEDEPVGRLKEAKIYYPLRDDPESVEICYADIECLAPEAFLSSTIMNFYIRAYDRTHPNATAAIVCRVAGVGPLAKTHKYLQRPVSATGRSRGDYHFFNTYFYEKLKEAVSYKRSDKDAFFVKLRRWWKGVNIFEKAYILLPIHESLHWSLVIICIPDKEDESGPVMLHLDSLGYHDSRQIFHNIKSYLVEEWNYLNKGVLPDLPIADRIWKHLPRRISDDIITVPQQKNDYDCGIFVLFFMERFIEEAPERLKKKDPKAMFGRQWFKPEEASKLRMRIRKLLIEEFENARIESDSRESSPSSSHDSLVGCTGNTTDS